MSRLEQAKAPALSLFETSYGSVEAFAAAVQAEIDGGTVDRRDGALILWAVRRWHCDRVWDLWQ